jgi:DNA-binding transcriptional LysR family regulator
VQSLDPDFLRTFVAIAETGSFARAGEAVHKTQSTVSSQIRRLEEILDARLFVRDGRRNVLTEKGKRLLEHARRMVRLNDETVGAFRAPEVSGSLTVGTCDDYAQRFFPDVLAGFARSHPNVDIEVVCSGTASLLASDKREAFDAIIVTVEPGTPGIDVLRRDRLYWIGPENFDLHREGVLPLAACQIDCVWRTAAIAALTEAGRDFHIAYTSSNVSLLAETVANGLAITAAPRWVLRPGLRVLEELQAKAPIGEFDVGLVLGARPRTAALEAFLDHLRRQFGAEVRLAA